MSTQIIAQLKALSLHGMAASFPGSSRGLRIAAFTTKGGELSASPE